MMERKRMEVDEGFKAFRHLSLSTYHLPVVIA